MNGSFNVGFDFSFCEGGRRKTGNSGRGSCVNRDELKSLKALIAYQAFNWGLPESFVENALCGNFGVKDLKNFPAAKYKSAVCWLVDGDPRLLGKRLSVSV